MLLRKTKTITDLPLDPFLVSTNPEVPDLGSYLFTKRWEDTNLLSLVGVRDRSKDARGAGWDSPLQG